MNKKHFKKIGSLALICLLVTAFIFPMNIKAINNPQNTPDWFSIKIEEFFGGQKLFYQFFDFDGNDMTEIFYTQNISAYQSRNFGQIYGYFCQNVKSIEKTVLTESVKNKALGDVTVNVQKDFTEQFETRENMSGYRCTLNWTMVASYVKNETYAAGDVVSTAKPLLKNFQFSEVGPIGVPQIDEYETYHVVSGGKAHFSFYIDLMHVSLATGELYERYPRYNWSGIFG